MPMCCKKVYAWHSGDIPLFCNKNPSLQSTLLKGVVISLILLIYLSCLSLVLYHNYNNFSCGKTRKQMSLQNANILLFQCKGFVGGRLFTSNEKQLFVAASPAWKTCPCQQESQEFAKNTYATNQTKKDCCGQGSINSRWCEKVLQGITIYCTAWDAWGQACHVVLPAGHGPMWVPKVQARTEGSSRDEV